MEIDFYNEAQKIWDNIARDGKIKRMSFELEVQKKLLNIFHVGDYYYFLFNIKKGEYEFMSPEIKPMLGFDSETISASYHLSHLHPEDQPYFLNFENKYIRILHQMVIIQHDDNGNLLRSLGIHTDISDLKESGKPVLSFIGLEGEPSFVNVEVENIFSPTKNMLSERERDILMLLIAGQTSTQIAAKLNIKKLTVDTHRKNILKKAQCSSTYELISKSINEGWV